METVTINNLKEWASKNPHSAMTLKRALPMMLKIHNSDYVMNTFKLIGTSHGRGVWYTEDLEPSGIVSFVLWYRDPLYRTANKKLRQQLYTEALLNLQLELEQNITGTQWSRFRKRFVERLNGNPSTTTVKDRPAFEAFWASRLNIQLVKISTRTDAGKHVSFVPSVETWTADKQIVFVDENFESVFIAPVDNHERHTLFKWISDIESDGWTVEWPIAEGSKEELDAAVIPLLRFMTIPEKAKKAELAVIVGKHQAISHLEEICNTDDF